MGWVGEWGAVDKNVPGGGNSKCNNPVVEARQYIQEDLKEVLSRERAGHSGPHETRERLRPCQKAF